MILKNQDILKLDLNLCILLVFELIKSQDSIQQIHITRL